MLKHERDPRPLVWVALVLSLAAHAWLLTTKIQEKAPSMREMNAIDVRLARQFPPSNPAPTESPAPTPESPSGATPEITQTQSDRVQSIARTQEVRPSSKPTEVTKANRDDSDPLEGFERWKVPPPIFPPPFLDRGGEATVGLSIVVTPAGSPLSVEITRTSGFPSLDDAASTAAMKRRFEPPIAGAVINKLVVFSIDRGEATP